MNYRAVSQGCRPQFGSYPIRSLLNYLGKTGEYIAIAELTRVSVAGCLGRPSGNKVRCFLDNLIHPLTTPALTIDTHMQRFLLGAGHTSFNTFEYAVSTCSFASSEMTRVVRSLKIFSAGQHSSAALLYHIVFNLLFGSLWRDPRVSSRSSKSSKKRSASP
jgi:hypothetical protein